MKFEITGGERKKVLERLERLAGEKAAYTRAPRFAYILKGIVLEKDNTVTTEGGADMALVRTLEAEGYIRAAEAYPEEEHTEPETAVEETPMEENEAADEETAVFEPIVEESVGNLLESIEQPVETVLENPQISTESESTDTMEEPAHGGFPYADLVERIEPVHLAVSFPLSKHRAESVCNLVYTLYSKGKLLSKATGGKFDASEELVEDLRSENFRVTSDVLSVLAEADDGALKGLRFTEEEVIFDGFPETDVKEEIETWTELFTFINKAAITQRHVRAKRTDDPNEKFAFRTWLTRMGMNGDELKAQRSLLYKRLDGHTAFRTAADEKKWRSRQAAKRQELLERKAAAENAQTLVEA